MLARESSDPQVAALTRRGRAMHRAWVRDVFSPFAGPRDPLIAMQNILDALGTLDVRGIATVGPAIGTQNLTAPQNVELRAFVPHAELLPVTRRAPRH